MISSSVVSFGEPFQGCLRLKLNRGNKARWGRFCIPSRTLSNLIGRRLELGKMYQIDGEIEGIATSESVMWKEALGSSFFRFGGIKPSGFVTGLPIQCV